MPVILTSANKAIADMDSSKGPGSDRVTVLVPKSCKSELSYKLIKLFNT